MKICLIKRLSDRAKIPTLGSTGSAGHDLYAANESDLFILPHSRRLIPTDLAMSIPRGVYGRIAGRSGLAKNHGIDVGGGVIDNDYRGSIGVILFNHSDCDFVVKTHDKIAQIIFECHESPIFLSMDHLDETDRGFDGFGSTGNV
jgi:dUTP pyrophosphatase